MDTAAYGARLLDEKQLMDSSSGGAFTALSNIVLEKGGAIAASVYDYEKREVVFRLLKTEEERNQAKGSKYIQCNPGTIYADCLQWLKENKEQPLLFIGTGCQTEAFRCYLNTMGAKYRSRVVLCDMICHGVPSPEVWKEYCKLVERKLRQPIKHLSFRDKRESWKNSTSFVVTESGEFSIQDYRRVYGRRCMHRECCYHCPFATIERKSDITLGDFWGIEEHYPEYNDSKGVSLVLLHSELGQSLWEDAAAQMAVFPAKIEYCHQPQLLYPTRKAENADRFWVDYQKHGIAYVMRKYSKDSLQIRLKRKLKKIFVR